MPSAHDLRPVDFLSTILRYRERFPEEEHSTSLFIKFLSDSLPLPNQNRESVFDRSNFDPGHFTGSAWIVDPQENLILLAHHRKLNKWLQLGGHADGDSNLFRVALREAQEESGLHSISEIQHDENRIFDLDVHAIPAHAGEPQHLHFDVRYLFAANSSEALKCSEESNALRWVELKDLADLSNEESLLRMHKKWRDGRSSAGFGI